MPLKSALKTISAKVPAEIKEIIENNAQKAGINKSDYLRSIIENSGLMNNAKVSEPINVNAAQIEKPYNVYNNCCDNIPSDIKQIAKGQIFLNKKIDTYGILFSVLIVGSLIINLAYSNYLNAGSNS